MSDLQAIADCVEIEALRGEFTDAGMMRDYDRLASLFTQDAVWRIPGVGVEYVGRQEIRAGVERLAEGLWDYLVQTTHPGTIQLEGDAASGRAYVLSFGHMRDGSSHLNYSVYHDRYQRTPGGLEVHRTRRRDQVPGHHSAGGLTAPRSGGRPLTCVPRTSLRRRSRGSGRDDEAVALAFSVGNERRHLEYSCVAPDQPAGEASSVASGSPRPRCSLVILPVSDGTRR